MHSFPTDSLTKILGDRYSVEREIGRGGMATVYLATDTRHARKVAVKVIDPNVAGALGVDRFLREIQVAARLTHPHIVPLYDSGATAGVLFFVMPYIRGESLRDRLLREGPFPLREVAGIARQIANALDYAHRQGIVHRDIKPDNVMLTEGHAVIADFGIAHAVIEASNKSLTVTGTVVGTPTYMSPEQGLGDVGIDGRCDQYALACVIYEMLTGRPPFTGGSALAIMVQHATAEPPRMVAPQPIPPAAEEAIRRSLAKIPDHRFATVSELADALDTVDDPPLVTAELPAVASRAPAARLPVPLTPLVGREVEVQAVIGLLRRQVRLITLHGSGGIGKTRLALEVASRATSFFPDGVWFVPLAEVREVESLMSRIAQAIGLRGTAASGQAVRDHLRDRDAVLVLDNFEQMAEEGATQVVDVLTDCPRLKVVVTSQVLLRVYSEHEFHVDPLPVPDIHHGGDNVAQLQRSPAVQLFVQRAVAARADFVLDASNAGAVIEICAQLDGVPLAIELAAARVRTMSPQSLVPKLRDTLAVLTGGARDVPQRQRTMRHALQWTHDLLTEDERVVFRRLAVFVGGTTAASAASVCGLGEAGATGDVLEALADRSLLRRQIDAAGESRYTMLRPVLAFAAEMLAEADEVDAIADGHAVYFRSLALEAEPLLSDGAWLDRLESDHDNLRMAIIRLTEGGLVADALRMAVALWRYWDARSYAREGLDQMGMALAQANDAVPIALRLAALFAAGVLADACGDYELGKRHLKENLRLTEALGDVAGASLARSNLGVLLLRVGDVEGAIPLFEAAVIAMRKVKNPQAMALGIANIGNAERMRKNFGAARTRYEEAREVFSAIGDRVNVAWSLSHLGDLAGDEGDADGSRAKYHEALAAFVAIGHIRGMVSVLMDLGELAASNGSLLEARGILEESLVHAADLGDQRSMVRIFEILAGVLSADGRHEDAVRLAGAVVGLRDRLGAPLSANDRARLQSRVASAVQQLDATSRDRVWRDGLAMSIDDVVGLVTTPEPPVV